MKHFILILVVVSALCVFRSNGHSNREFLKNWNCISESGNDLLCDGFQSCMLFVPQCLLLPYQYCLRKILPEGVGQCSDTEQAYGSESDRVAIDKCYSEITTLPNGDHWTSFPEYVSFLNCVQYLGNLCESSKSSGSSGSSESNESGRSKSSSSESSESGSSDSSE